MMNWEINRAQLRDPSWWHWMITIPLLAAYLGVVGVGGCGVLLIWTVIGLCALMGAWYCMKLRAVRPFAVQIRLGFLVLLLLGLAPPLFWIHWVLFAGTIARVSVGYCAMHRLLLLLPWNRTSALTTEYVMSTFLRLPCAGGLITLSGAAHSAGACSIT
jgi:hypothetical protein